MGNTCEQCDENQVKKEFKPIDSSSSALKLNLQMLPIKDEIRSKYSQQILNKTIEKPKLNSKVSQTLNKQLSQRPLTVSNEYKGQSLIVQFLQEKNVYYEGEWLDDEPHGKGSVYFPGGSYLQSYFNKGEASCKDAILVFPDGSFYRGQIEKSLFQGKGKLVSSNGTAYEGDWKNGVPHGKGQQTFANGNSYIGSFTNGVKQGNGIFRWSDGKVYEGEFKNGKMHGMGKLQKGDQIFEGYFQQNKKVGKCKLKTVYGVYDSEFKEGQITGKGTFQFKNHTVYRGEFEKGMPHGEGTIQLPNGQTVVAIFEHGKTVKVTDIKNKNQPE